MSHKHVALLTILASYFDIIFLILEISLRNFAFLYYISNHINQNSFWKPDTSQFSIYNAFYRRNHFFLPYLYAQIYWLAEFGDVSCLQFNYLRVETLTPTWEDFVGRFCRTILRATLSSSPTKLVSDLRVWSLIHLVGSVH
jgi:hypothetical protein